MPFSRVQYRRLLPAELLKLHLDPKYGHTNEPYAFNIHAVWMDAVLLFKIWFSGSLHRLIVASEWSLIDQILPYTRENL